MIVISDITPIISLIKIEKLNLLKELYGQIIIPEAVFSELTANPDFENETSIVKNSNFIRTVKVTNTEILNILKKISGLDSGESESIVLMVYQVMIHVLQINKGVSFSLFPI